MAQYTITHACGHTTTQQIYGKNSHGERDNKVRWWQSVDCPACYGRKKSEESENRSNVEADILNDIAKIGLVIGAKMTANGQTVTTVGLTPDQVTIKTDDGKKYTRVTKKIVRLINNGEIKVNS